MWVRAKNIGFDQCIGQEKISKKIIALNKGAYEIN